MSGHGFHVHGPHDHAVEHAAQHGSDGFSNNIAVMTAVLATVGALFGYLGGATQNDAALFKNDAAIAKTTAANAWNYYQAKSSRQNLAELAATLPGVDGAKYKADAARYEAQKADIKKEAEKYEAEAERYNAKSERALHTHHQWALATTAEQIAISLAAITLLTRRRWLLGATYAVAGIGLLLGAFAWLHVDPIGALLAGGAAPH
ncbi:DUF4337 domain-containing protein [Massilia sp. YIM B02763]|uniref:DUF4337 domain-containing protein n=1 Tax=Massilia sp. YIM B02763 TaxID=3050130 RepID=UPI0025B694C3|nr:DUF4337 domain-containing protein [Massilia sp. YIM B02763]MDN4054293.1 DUF4337 domain-containing protein [Massilia sp. YIM B02763]